MAMKNPPHPGLSLKENCIDPDGITIAASKEALTEPSITGLRAARPRRCSPPPDSRPSAA